MPKSEQDVVDAILRATQLGLRVKAIGSGHSFTAISKPDEMMLDMSRLNAVIEVDAAHGVVRVQSGIVLSDLNEYLEKHGLSMPNLGDVAYQSLAGSMSTSTHGTGLSRTGLAAQIMGFRMVLASGEVIVCSADENQEIFHCGRGFTWGAWCHYGVLDSCGASVQPASGGAADASIRRFGTV